MSATAVRTFFGDKEHAFDLAPVIVELEAVTSTGIGALCQRVFAGQFKHADLVEVIRLGLVGAGENPEIAARLTETYAKARPVTEALPIALSALEALWFGASKPENAP